MSIAGWNERCVLCLEEKRSPVRIKCGHSFCLECLDVYKSYQKYAWANRCPICRGALKDKRCNVRKRSQSESIAAAATEATALATTSAAAAAAAAYDAPGPSSTIGNNNNRGIAVSWPTTPPRQFNTAAGSVILPFEDIYLLEEFMALAAEEQESTNQQVLAAGPNRVSVGIEQTLDTEGTEEQEQEVVLADLVEQAQRHHQQYYDELLLEVGYITEVVNEVSAFTELQTEGPNDEAPIDENNNNDDDDYGNDEGNEDDDEVANDIDIDEYNEYDQHYNIDDNEEQENEEEEIEENVDNCYYYDNEIMELDFSQIESDTNEDVETISEPMRHRLNREVSNDTPTAEVEAETEAQVETQNLDIDDNEQQQDEENVEYVDDYYYYDDEFMELDNSQTESDANEDEVVDFETINDQAEPEWQTFEREPSNDTTAVDVEAEAEDLVETLNDDDDIAMLDEVIIID